MREPMKYINGPMGFFAPCDTYVRWADYAALAAEKADTLIVMAKLHMEYRRLQSENERLRKAGDELARVAIPSYILDVKTKAIEAWLAAKGERP